ncbi:MAG: J domain-containing protein, partial [Deltaproteobacteria bacterium]
GAASQDAGASAWGRPQDKDAGGVRSGAGATVYPQEVRLAYAALELPLGADKDEIQRAYRELLSRYHPDKHANNPQLQQAANELTRRIKEARDRLLAWRA